MNAPGLGTAATLARRIVPGLTVLLLIVLGALPLPLPYYADVVPWLPLMAIYYWVVFRPDLMPRTLAFALGLFHDAVLGAPFGLMALVYLLFQAFVLTQRRFLVGKPFWIFWGGFALIATPAVALAWLLASALRGALLPPDATAVALALTIVGFPLVAWVLVRMQRWVVGTAEPA